MRWLCLLLTGCVANGPNQIRVTAALASDSDSLPFDIVADMDGLELRAVDTPWSDPWEPLADTPTALTLGRDEWLTVGEGVLPSGSYEHVFLKVSNLAWAEESAAPPILENVVEPIAAPVTLSGGRLTEIHIWLVALRDLQDTNHIRLLAKDTEVTP